MAPTPTSDDWRIVYSEEYDIVNDAMVARLEAYCGFTGYSVSWTTPASAAKLAEALRAMATKVAQPQKDASEAQKGASE